MKIFGIGLERTGTTSLAVALCRLGFTTHHFPRTTNDIDEADFSDDITVACRYRDLDAMYPGSKFILTTREEDAWIDSCARWYGHLAERQVLDFAAMAAALRLYHSESFDPDLWRMGRLIHEQDVLEYFADRPGDLLVIDICAGQGWGKLLPFLAAALGPFPHENAFQAVDSP